MAALLDSLRADAQPRALDLKSPVAQLALASVSIALLLGMFVVALPLWAGQPSTPPVPGSADAQPVGWAGAVLMLVFVCAACLPFRPYHLAQRALERAAAPALLLVGSVALAAVAAAFIYPSFGGDIFDYVGFERMWVVYGDNPLSALPINHLADWSTAYVWYPDRTPAYGPLWAVITWPIVRLAGDSPMAEVLGYKLMSIVAYAACCLLIWSSVERTRRQQALVAFALSPLILLEVLGKLHNDILPALSVLAAVWLLKRRRSRWLSLTAGVAGGLVKITALAAAPPLILFLVRRAGWRAAIVASALALAFCLALYAPFWAGPQTLAPIWNQTSRVIWSPESLLIVASSSLPGAPYSTPIHVLFALVCLGLCAALVLRSRIAGHVELATASGWVLLISVYLLTSAVYAHYLVPAVALAAVSNDKRLQRLVFWLSVGGQAAYGVDLLGLTLGPAWLDSDAYRVVGTLVLLGPAALVLARAGLGRAQSRFALA